MDFDRLYHVTDTDARGTFRVELGRAFEAFDIVRGVEEPCDILRFRRCTGRRVLDVIGTGDPVLLLWSPRAINVLRDGGFTGWTSFPVQIVGMGSQEIDGYEGLVVTGRCGAIDHSKEKRVRKPPRVPQGQPYDAWIGVYFDPDSWDGSDVFMPEGTAFKVVTEPVKVALELAGITNLSFEPLTECERTWPV